MRQPSALTPSAETSPTRGSGELSAKPPWKSRRPTVVWPASSALRGNGLNFDTHRLSVRPDGTDGTPRGGKETKE